MKTEYVSNTISIASTFCNRKLLKKIENKNTDIRSVMRFAVDKGLIPKQEWDMMDIQDAWRWLVMNKVDYEE